MVVEQISLLITILSVGLFLTWIMNKVAIEATTQSQDWKEVYNDMLSGDLEKHLWWDGMYYYHEDVRLVINIEDKEEANNLLRSIAVIQRIEEDI